MAKPYAYDTSTDALLRPARNAVFFDEWTPADYENHNLLCAEMSRLAYASQDVVRKSLNNAEFNSVDFIGGDDLGSRAKTGGTQAFVASSAIHGVTILAFRGTESDTPEDVITDLLTFPAPSRWDNCRVHGGFANRYGRVADKVVYVCQGSVTRLSGGSADSARPVFSQIGHRSRMAATTGQSREGR